MPNPEALRKIERLRARVESLEAKVRELDARTVGDIVIGPGRTEGVPRRTIEEIQAQADELTRLFHEKHADAS